MPSLRENINYSEFIICPHCKNQVEYHVTDIKGVDEKYVICPNCRKKLHIN